MGDFKVLKQQWETASRNDGTFFQGIDATMGYVSDKGRRYCCSPGTCFAPLGQLHRKGTDKFINKYMDISPTRPTQPRAA